MAEWFRAHDRAVTRNPRLVLALEMHKYLQMVQLLRGFPTLPYTECTYILLFRNDGRPVVEAGGAEKGSFAHLQALGPSTSCHTVKTKKHAFLYGFEETMHVFPTHRGRDLVQDCGNGSLNARHVCQSIP